MSVNVEIYKDLIAELDPKKIILVAVSKTKPVQDIMALYDLGQRDFGENYVQELLDKQAMLPKDIRWHFIGHLQTNKVKQIASFVQLIHGVDSLKLLKEINKQGEKTNRIIDCLLQIHIAREETKFGLDEVEASNIIREKLSHAHVTGLMGMASFTDDKTTVQKEFSELQQLFAKLQVTNPSLRILSAGMSADYRIAMNYGSTMVRIGSILFGSRM